MELLQDCSEESIFRRQIELFCRQVGLDYASEATTSSRFIIEVHQIITKSLLEARSYQLMDITLSGELVYLHQLNNTVATGFPYASILRKYFYENPNASARRLMDREVRSTIRDYQKGREHWLLVELSQIQEQLLKSSFELFQDNRFVLPAQTNQRFKLYFDDVSSYYGGKYSHRLFFKSRITEWSGLEPKQIYMDMLIHFGLLGSSAGLNRYLALLVEHLQIPPCCSILNFGYQYKELMALKLPPALLYVAQSWMYFQRRLTRHLVEQDELYAYFTCSGTSIFSLESSQRQDAELQFEQIGEVLQDSILISIVTQIGLRCEYDVLAKNLSNICRFLVSKSNLHQEWTVAVFPQQSDIGVLWKHKSGRIVRVYPFLLQLVVYLSDRPPFHSPVKNSNDNESNKLPKISDLLSEVNSYRRDAVGEFLIGQVTVDEALKAKALKNITGADLLNARQLQQLIYCTEYSKDNIPGAKVVLKIVGTRSYENPTELTAVVEELKSIRRLEIRDTSEEASPKRKIGKQKQPKPEEIQLEFKRLAGVLGDMPSLQKMSDPAPSLENITPPVNPTIQDKSATSRKSRSKGTVEVDHLSHEGSNPKLRVPTVQQSEIALQSEDRKRSSQEPFQTGVLGQALRNIKHLRSATEERPEQPSRKDENDPMDLQRPKILILQTEAADKTNLLDSTMNSSFLHQHEPSMITIAPRTTIIDEELGEDVEAEASRQPAQNSEGFLQHLAKTLSDPIEHLETANPAMFKNVFRTKKHSRVQHSKRINPEQISTEESDAVNIPIRLLTTNLASVYPASELANYLLQQTHLMNKLLDFHTKKEWYSESRQETILFNLIEEMYWQLRKNYQVDWRNDQLQRRIQETSLPLHRNTRSYSLRNIKRMKDMPIQKVVDIVIAKKQRLNNPPTLKVPTPNNLFYPK